MSIAYEDKPNIVQIDKSGNNIEIAYGGPQGPVGPTGPTGPTGPAGAFVLEFPTNPYPGQVWVDLETGKMYVYYVDGETAQWIQVGVAPQGPTGPTGPEGVSGVVAVSSPITNSGTSTAANIGINQDGFGHISNLSYAQFDVTNTTSPTIAGRLAWNNTDKTLDLFTGNGGVTLQLGQEFVQYCQNQTGALIPEGAVVRVVGSIGQRLEIALASNDSESDSTATFGVVTHAGGIAHGSIGFVTLLGLVRGLNTLAFDEGDSLWLGADGTFTNVKPIQPLHLVHIGWVVVKSGNGTIFVKIQNGYELEELHNVLITNPQDGDVLKYQASTGLWINGTA